MLHVREPLTAFGYSLSSVTVTLSADVSHSILHSSVVDPKSVQKLALSGISETMKCINSKPDFSNTRLKQLK